VLFVAENAIKEGLSPAGILTLLSPYLTPEQNHSAQRDALVAVETINNENDRADALMELIPHLAPADGTGALVIATAFRSDWNRTRALTALVPHLAPEQRKEALRNALTAAKVISDDYYRCGALGALAPHLISEQRNEALRDALAAADAISDRRARTAALVALAPKLATEQKDRALTDALAAARSIEDEFDRAEAIAALALHLAPEKIDGAVHEALAAIKPAPAFLFVPDVSPARRRPHSIPKAKSLVTSEERRSAAFVALAVHLPPEEKADALREALAAAKAILFETDRAKALAALITHFPPEHRDAALREAIHAAMAIDEEFDRSGVLVALAPHLKRGNASMAAQVLEAARLIRDEICRANVLKALVDCVPAPLSTNCLLALIDTAGSLPRYAALSAAAAGARLTSELGGQKEILALSCALHDVFSWYP
jgi:hypothetical protein